MNKTIILTAVLACFATSAFADESHATDGFYAGFKAGMSSASAMNTSQSSTLPVAAVPATNVSPGSPAIDAPQSTLSNKNTSGEILVGYRFKEHYAVEAGYQYNGSYNASGTSYAGTTELHKFNVQQLNLSVIDVFPITEKIDLYAKVGATYAFSSLDANQGGKFGVLLGGGATYWVTPQIEVAVDFKHSTVAYNNFGKIGGSTSVISVGPTYHF